MAQNLTSVRAGKRKRLSDGEPWQDLELFPTPPWATRALLQCVPLPETHDIAGGAFTKIWEPCAGLGHMSDVLHDECRGFVFSTDVFDWGRYNFRQEFMIDALNGDAVDRYARSFPGDGPDWIITNPPFSQAENMLRNFLGAARKGVAMLLRMQWEETEGRYERVYTITPPTLIAQFSERVAMCEGGYDPELSGATAYAWFIWLRDDLRGDWRKPVLWQPNDVRLDKYLIPPCKNRLRRDSDQALAARCVPGFMTARERKQGMAA